MLVSQIVQDFLKWLSPMAGTFRIFFPLNGCELGEDDPELA